MAGFPPETRRLSSPCSHACQVSFADTLAASIPPEGDSLTGSGLFDSPSSAETVVDDGSMSGDFSTIDMVNRLEPRGFRWIESSPAEQEFLGWTLSELKQRSFLDVVHPDDRDVAEEALRQTLAKGEFHGLVVRIRTAAGQDQGRRGQRRRPL